MISFSIVADPWLADVAEDDVDCEPEPELLPCAHTDRVDRQMSTNLTTIDANFDFIVSQTLNFKSLDPSGSRVTCLASVRTESATPSSLVVSFFPKQARDAMRCSESYVRSNLEAFKMPSMVWFKHLRCPLSFAMKVTRHIGRFMNGTTAKGTAVGALRMSVRLLDGGNPDR